MDIGRLTVVGPSLGAAPPRWAPGRCAGAAGAALLGDVAASAQTACAALCAPPCAAAEFRPAEGRCRRPTCDPPEMGAPAGERNWPASSGSRSMVCMRRSWAQFHDGYRTAFFGMHDGGGRRRSRRWPRRSRSSGKLCLCQESRLSEGRESDAPTQTETQARAIPGGPIGVVAGVACCASLVARRRRSAGWTRLLRWSTAGASSNPSIHVVNGFVDLSGPLLVLRSFFRRLVVALCVVIFVDVHFRSSRPATVSGREVGRQGAAFVRAPSGTRASIAFVRHSDLAQSPFLRFGAAPLYTRPSGTGKQGCTLWGDGSCRFGRAKTHRQGNARSPHKSGIEARF